MILYALVSLVLIVIVSFAQKSKDKFGDICVGAAIVAFVCALLPALSVVTTRLRPVTFDAQLHGIDLRMGLDGIKLTHWLLRTGLYAAVGPVYYSLTIVFALAWVIDRSRELIRDSFISAIAAMAFYLLVPAVGPQYAFQDFPNGSIPLLHVGPDPHNCFPSMHFCWMLLIVINARNKIWRWIAAAYTIPMAIATVGSGEHYFIDLIAAIPFAFGTHWLLERYLSRPAAAEKIGGAE